MAGPFKGAPLSLVAITPALAGPYDYGTVVVRVAFNVDPLTAQVRAVSDTIPQIIGGIPIRLRSIQVNIDRPNFTINPTNCAAALGRIARGSATRAQRSASPPLPRGQLRHPGLRPEDDDDASSAGASRPSAPKTPPADRPLDRRGRRQHQIGLAVTLPNAFQIDQRHLGNICAKAELESKHCAGRQAIGTAYVRRHCSTNRSQAPSTRSRATASCPASPSSWTAR